MGKRTTTESVEGTEVVTESSEVKKPKKKRIPLCDRSDSPYNPCPNQGQADHTCPYAEEINGDEETLCNCCKECENECAMEI